MISGKVLAICLKLFSQKKYLFHKKNFFFDHKKALKCFHASIIWSTIQEINVLAFRKIHDIDAEIIEF